LYATIINSPIITDGAVINIPQRLIELAGITDESLRNDLPAMFAPGFTMQDSNIAQTYSAYKKFDSLGLSSNPYGTEQERMVAELNRQLFTILQNNEVFLLHQGYASQGYDAITQAKVVYLRERYKQGFDAITGELKKIQREILLQKTTH
jgi:hypothetical protein